MKKTILLFLLILSASFSNHINAQIKHFTGSWTKDGTTYDFKFDLYLHHTGGNQVKGVFNWEFAHYDENMEFSKEYYEKKIGTQAKEYVRGTYNSKTRQYILKGYKKDDPGVIISLDTYRLKEDENGNIGGDTKAHGAWNGRINGKAIRTDQV